jgi:hypothetical protein
MKINREDTRRDAKKKGGEKDRQKNLQITMTKITKANKKRNTTIIMG